MLAEWHDQGADLTCVDIQTFYDNRSDTAVDVATQSFRTSYTPKHKPGQYPDDVDGPMKTLHQTVGIPAYTLKEINWEVCAPELKSKQNPPAPDGTDSFMSEIGARPITLRWAWTE